MILLNELILIIENLVERVNILAAAFDLDTFRR